jgi:hypothetical protein
MNAFDKRIKHRTRDSGYSRLRGSAFGVDMSQIPINQLPGTGFMSVAYNPGDLSTAMASAKSQAASDANANNPIELSTPQQVGQWFQKLTGQLNDKGDANGPGFMHSKLISYVEYAGIGVLVLGGLYLLGPVFTFGAAALSSKR